MNPKMPSLFDDDFFSDEEREAQAAQVPPTPKPAVDTQPSVENQESAPATVERSIKKETEELNPQTKVTQEKDNSIPQTAANESAPAEDQSSANTPPESERPGDEAKNDQTEKVAPPSLEKITRSRPALELPPVEEDTLDDQIQTALIQSDYVSRIYRDYPFAPDKIEVVKPEKRQVAQPPENEKTKEPADSPDSQTSLRSTNAEEEAALPEWHLTKNYYTIGEVAQLFEVNISHIRFWTNEFKLKPRTNRKGDRLYAPSQIETLRLIHYLVKVKKFTLKGAKEKLKGGKEAINHQLALKDSLIQLRDSLLEIKGQLK